MPGNYGQPWSGLDRHLIYADVICRRTGTFLSEPTYLDMVNLAAVFSKRFKEGFKFKKVLNEPDFEDVHRGRISKSLLEQLLRTFRSG